MRCTLISIYLFSIQINTTIHIHPFHFFDTTLMQVTTHTGKASCAVAVIDEETRFKAFTW